MQIFEVLMLIGFGASWPVSIHKSWVSRSTGGKSLVFLLLVLFGYLCGIAHKATSDFDWVSYLYIFNAVLTTTDILLFFRNRGYEKTAEESKKRSEEKSPV